MSNDAASALAPAVQVLLAVLPAVALAINAAAFWLNAIQARRTNRVTRASLVASAIREFLGDGEAQKAFYLIEYGEFRYDRNFHGSPLEQQVDRLLRQLANLAVMWESGVLSRRDLAPLEYYILRVARDAAVQQYLSFMERWAQRARITRHPYESFSRLALEFDAK